MQIWPAIDIRGGKCVRLEQGDYQRETVFGDDPLEMARRWCDLGAECLHLVDLDGARDGRPVNAAVIESIAQSFPVPCQLGGGVRDEASIERLLGLGLRQLVIGTRAIEDPGWFRRMAERFPRQLVLGLDSRQGVLATDGWLRTSTWTAVALARDFRGVPLAAIVYTDIHRDGMLTGPNQEALAEMKAAADCPVIASGGVRECDDVIQLAQLGLDGCIIGRALYEGRISLPEAIRAGQVDWANAGSDPRRPPQGSGR